jgi:hypothetical protein
VFLRLFFVNFVETRTRSYDPKLQRQRCKNLQRHENIFITVKKRCVYVAYYNAGVVVSFSEVVGLAPRPNPTIPSYNANALKIYNATSSQVRFKNKNTFLLWKTL